MVESIYVLHVLLTLAVSAWPLAFARSTLKLGWINPFSIAWVIALPVQFMKLFAGPWVLLDKGLMDDGYQFALLMTNLAALAQWGGTVMFFDLSVLLKIERWLPWQDVTLRPRDFGRIKLLFLALFAVALTLLASAEFGVFNWLANPRTGYQMYRTGQGHWYAAAVNFLAVAYVFSVLHRPKATWVIANTALFLALAYLLGSKGNMLSIFVSGLVFLWFLGWRHLGKVFAIGTPILFAALLLNLFLALGDTFELQSILEYFDYYKNAADYYNAHLNGELPLFWGEVSISSLWSYVPRVLAPDKPTVYGILLVNEIFYPGQAELTNTPAFGGAVEQYADFGVVGVGLFNAVSSVTLFGGPLYYLLFRRPGAMLTRMTMASTLLVLAQYGPAFGSFLPSLLYLLMLAFVMLSLYGLRRPLAPLVQANG
jgi:hypothetical protein